MSNIENSQDLLLGRYQIIEDAGSGGYGKVIHGYDTRLKREVAIKIIDLDGAEIEYDKEGNVAKLPGLEEARAAGKLSSANIVTIYDCIVFDFKAYVIEEYVEGITLTQLMATLDSNITLDIIATIFASVSRALQSAHKKNILHLDIKPDNILIGRAGEVKVADFGLATLMDINGIAKVAAGTLGYMPPEQMRKGELDQRSDEFSLALVLYEMLTGQNPLLSAKSLDEACRIAEMQKFVLPSQCWEDIDENIDNILFKAMSGDPAIRFSTIKEFADEIKPMLGSQKAGTRQLAIYVNGNDDNVIDTSTINIADEMPENIVATYPLVDRLGRKGFKIILNILDLISLGLVAGVVGINVSWISGILVGIVLVCLWLFVIRKKSEIGIAATLPLFGAVSLSCAVPAMAGAALNVRDAVKCVVITLIIAIAFALLGSCSIYGWEAGANAILTASPDTLAPAIAARATKMFTSLSFWTSALSWILATFSFSLCCARGTRTFDYIGSFFFFIFIISGTLIPHFIYGEVLNPLNVIGALTGSFVAILLVAISFTDRVRYPVEEW